jgi:hypothetical protein
VARRWFTPSMINRENIYCSHLGAYLFFLWQ